MKFMNNGERSNSTSLAELGTNNYGDPLEEARLCRRDCALFDFSFMSRFRITGDQALPGLHRIQSRDLGSMQAGDIRYCLHTGADDRVVSDLTVWKFADDSFEVFSGRQRDLEMVAERTRGVCGFEDLSASTSVFSIQGPGSLERLSRLGDTRALLSLAYFQHGNIALGGIPCQIGRLGYTGEKGFEIIVDDRDSAVKLWGMLSEACRPAGVAAIDILRIEAGFILFLNECRTGYNAVELGLDPFFDGDPSRRRFQLVCFRAREDTIEMPWSPPANLPEPGAGEITVTSAALNTLCEGILGLGFVRHPAMPGDLYRDPLDRFHGIRRVDLPFYDPGKRLPRSSWERPER